MSFLHAVATDLWLSRICLEGAISTVLIIAAYVMYRVAPQFVTRLSQAVIAALNKQHIAITLAALVPLVFRCLLLPALPAPYPEVHDEFVHLLVADTLTHGRMANPPHVLSEHFETEYVLQKPTYSAIYPIGNGALLAGGKVLFGTYWTGVCLGIALMAGAICWMICAWLPPIWGFAGGVLAALIYGAGTYWMNSYWGGAVAAIGGAIHFGSLGRLRHHRRTRYFLLAAIGWAILFLTRPFEALVLTFATVLLASLRWKATLGYIRALKARRAFVGCAAIVLLAEGVVLLQNYSVTGHATTIPYLLSQKEYGVPQGLMFQPVVPEPAGLTRNQHQMYEWQRNMRVEQMVPRRFFARIETDLFRLWTFYMNYALTIPIVIALFFVRSWTVRLFVAILALAYVGSLAYPFFSMHYFAAYSGVFLLLAMLGFRVMYHWRPAGRPVGAVLATWLIMSGALMGARLVGLSALKGKVQVAENPRALIERQLRHMPDPQLVFVKYGEHHDVHREWVYNAADIDSAKIIWAQTLGTDSDRALIAHYPERRAWIVYADSDSPELRPYAAEPIEHTENRAMGEGVRNRHVDVKEAGLPEGSRGSQGSQ